MSSENEERWKRLVSDFESSDLKQAEFARERDISVHALRYWIYRGRQASKASPAKVVESTEEKGNRLRLLPVKVVASAPKARQSKESLASIELVLPSGVVVRFPAATSPDYLWRLVRAL